MLFSGDVDQVDLPGAEGDMGILAGHAPLVTALRPGIVTIFSGGAREDVRCRSAASPKWARPG